MHLALDILPGTKAKTSQTEVERSGPCLPPVLGPVVVPSWSMSHLDCNSFSAEVGLPIFFYEILRELRFFFEMLSVMKGLPGKSDTNSGLRICDPIFFNRSPQMRELEAWFGVKSATLKLSFTTVPTALIATAEGPMENWSKPFGCWRMWRPKLTRIGGDFADFFSHFWPNLGRWSGIVVASDDPKRWFVQEFFSKILQVKYCTPLR